MIRSVRQAIELEVPPHFTHNTGSKWGQTHDMPFGFIAGIVTSIGTAVAGSIGAGVAAASAIAAGGAVTLAGVGAIVGAIGTVATIAGLGLTVIGLATGNKTLTKIGGYIGLAGGVAGIAAAGLSAAGGAAAAAGEAGAAAGQAAATEATKQVATETVKQTVTQSTAEAAKQAVVQASTEVANKGSWFGNFFDDIGNQFGTMYDKGASLIGNAGTDTVAEVAKKSAPLSDASKVVQPTTSTITEVSKPVVEQTAAKSSFFESLFKSDNLKNVLEIGKVGASMLGGSAKQDMENQTLDKYIGVKYADLGQQQYKFDKELAFKQQESAYQKLQDEIKMRNKNSIANLEWETQQATPEQKDAYEKAKLEKIRQTAASLVTPAPLATGFNK